MGWISRMIQRGGTVSPEAAMEAIGAFQRAKQYDLWAGQSQTEREYKIYMHNRDLAYARYYELSQGVSYGDLEELVQGFWDD